MKLEGAKKLEEEMHMAEDEAQKKEVRADLRKGVAHIKTKMCGKPSAKYEFGFLMDSDSLEYINKCLPTPLVLVGSKYSGSQTFGSPTDNYMWSQDATLRNECVSMLSAHGVEGDWKRRSIELSGARGVEFAPMDLESVRGFRYVLSVSVPEAEPASKRRRA